MNAALAMGGANGISARRAPRSLGATSALGGYATTTASLTGAGTVSLGSGTLTTGRIHPLSTGILTGTGGLVESGVGSLALSGNSTYSGTTSIQAGGITLSSANGLGGASGAVVISSGAFSALENNAFVDTKVSDSVVRPLS